MRYAACCTNAPGKLFSEQTQIIFLKMIKLEVALLPACRQDYLHNRFRSEKILLERLNGSERFEGELFDPGDFSQLNEYTSKRFVVKTSRTCSRADCFP